MDILKLMSPFRRFFDFISYPSHSRTIGFLAFLVILLAIPLTVNIAQKQQELRQHAANLSEGGSGNCTTQTTTECHIQGSEPSGCTIGGNGCTLYTGFAGYRSYVCTKQVCTSQAPSTSSGGGTTTTGKPCGNQGGTCRAGVCVVGPNQDVIDANGSVDCRTGAGGTGGTSACSAPYSGPCVAPYNYVGAKQEPACTRSSGASGKSVTVCQQVGSNLCWYDQYTDNTKTQAERDAGCYVTTTGTGGPTPSPGGTTTGISISCPGGGAPVCSSGHSATKLVSGNWVCSNTTTGQFVSSPAPTCPTGATKLTFSVGLDGIGTTGDQKNSIPNPISKQSRGSNKDPRHKERSITVEAAASDGTKTTANGTMTYNSSTGKYDATVNFPSLKQGTYSFKIKSDIYLRRTVASWVVAPGQTYNLPLSVNLVTGDIDKDNRLSVSDYNFFSPGNCLFKAASGVCASADLNDDGIVDQYDYNLFLREIAVVQNGE